MNIDAGAHYRYHYRGLKFDPFRAALIFGITCPILFTVFKKIIRAGGGGYKDEKQDILDCICALERKLEIMKEDGKL